MVLPHFWNVMIPSSCIDGCSLQLDICLVNFLYFCPKALIVLCRRWSGKTAPISGFGVITSRNIGRTVSVLLNEM